MLCDYESKFLNKTKVQTLILTRQDFIVELLNGSITICYELPQMEKTCFVNFCDDLRRRNLLDNSRGVMLKEKITTFLFFIRHNICHKVVVDHF